MFNFSDIYARLAEAKAAIEVTTAEDLARNVQELLAPDRAAELAKAAWEVSSRGAEVTERAVTTLLEIFDNRGA